MLTCYNHIMMRIRFLTTPLKLGLMTVLTPKSEKVESEILYLQYCTMHNFSMRI